MVILLPTYKLQVDILNYDFYERTLYICVDSLTLYLLIFYLDIIFAVYLWYRGQRYVSFEHNFIICLIQSSFSKKGNICGGVELCRQIGIFQKTQNKIKMLNNISTSGLRSWVYRGLVRAV